MDDLISRAAALDEIDVFLAVDKYYHPYSQGKTIPVEEMRERLKQLPSAQPDLSEYSDKLWRSAYERGKAEAQAKIIRCRDCKWWGYDDDTGVVRVCHAAKHGHISSHWDIHIFRTYRGDFYCADAERRTDEPDK